MAFLILFISFLLVMVNSNLAVKLGYILSFVFAVFFYFKSKIFVKFSYIVLTSYCLFAPLILGFLDYKKFSFYERIIETKNPSFYATYCLYKSNCNIQETKKKREMNIV